MAKLKLPDVNFAASGYSFYGSSNSSTVLDATLCGIAPMHLYAMWYYINPALLGGINGLFLYKGTPAVQSEIDSLDSTTTTVSATSGVLRASDLLCYLPTKTFSTNKNVMTLSFSPAVALASGSATWFILGRYYSSYANTCFLSSGTVGLAGSGADLELLTTTITAGVIYKQPACNIVIPNSLSA